LPPAKLSAPAVQKIFIAAGDGLLFSWQSRQEKKDKTSAFKVCLQVERSGCLPGTYLMKDIEAS